MAASAVEEKKKNTFKWSLKPLLIITKFTAGIPLHFTPAHSKKSIAIRLMVTLIGFLISFSNLLINGPRGINKGKFSWMNVIQNYESPYLLFKENPELMLEFVIDVTSICFFIAVPLIQFVFFMTVVWSKNWTRLVSSIKIIQKEMNLSKQFYKKCRTRCLVAILILILVN